MSVRIEGATRYGDVVKSGHEVAPALLATARGVTPRRVPVMHVQRTMSPVACAHCAATFSRRHKAQRFCSHPCYWADLAARRTPEERFWSYVQRSEGDDACWLWTGGRNGEGYGHLWLNGRNIGAHRFAWTLRTGDELGADDVIGHTCDTPACVRHDDEGAYEVDGILLPRRGHLFRGTDAHNMHDRDRKGRANTPVGDRNWTRIYPDMVRRGEDKCQARLTWPKVREIRRRVAAGETQKALAREFEVDRSVVSRIASGKSWPLRAGERPW